jgi:hypothetical protein
MSGVPGAGGPIPKRSDQRRRRNKPEVEIDTAPSAPVSAAPEPAAGWHPIARDWYVSLGRSGQSAFYQPSDWATAFLIAESMSRDLKPQFVGTDAEGAPIIMAIPLKGASLASYLKAMTVLLATEGDRRRARLELERGKRAEDLDDIASVTAISDWQSRLSG